MPRIKHILFPTSCGENANNAFNYVLAIARYFGASIKVLHVCEPSPDLLVPGIMRYQMIREQQKSAKIMLDDWLQQFDLDGISVSKDVELGYAKETIAIYANKETSIDLIALGIKNAKGFSKMIWGTIVSQTIEAAQAPVLVIPKGIEFHKIKQMAYVTPLLDDWRSLYGYVKAIAQQFGAKLFVTHLPQSQVKASKATATEAEHVVLEDYAAALYAFAYNQSLDLLVTVAAVRNTFQRILKYSKAQKMAFEAIIPLLVLKPSLVEEKA